jgi:hypothetical protein
VKSGKRWRFDSAAGKAEVLVRRIGRNELAVIGICRAYVAAQRRYAQQGHDGKPAGLFATSEEGRDIGTDRAKPTPFHGYYFKILTAQGSAAPGGAKSYLVDGEMSAGFALVAWPAEYDSTGIMTFVVNQDGRVYETDLGAKTAATAAAMTAYNPDAAWRQVR